MTPLLLVLAAIAGAVLTAAAGYFYLKRRAVPEAVLHFRCKHCGQRLRYSAGRAGRRIMCPSCLRACSLPPVPEKC